MKLENKIKVVLDLEIGMECLLAIHQSLGVKTFQVEVLIILIPQFKDSPLLQALLANLEVVLLNELITQLNDSIEIRVAIGGHDAMVDESDQDALIPNYSNKRFGNDDDVDSCKLKLMLLLNLLLLIRIVSSVGIS